MHDMPMGHEHRAADAVHWAPWVWLPLLAVLGVAYLLGVVASQRRLPWPWYRSAAWGSGLLLAGGAVIGPVATRAHTDFRAHMIAHLLLGMAAPIALVTAGPVTLLLRALRPASARQVVRLLGSRPFRTISHPVTAAALNIGGLWLLYSTRLYPAMHERAWLAMTVHLHILIAGYLFTAAMIGVDPIRHRPSREVRTVVLICAIAAHAVLAKLLVRHPPSGVSFAEAESAGRVMYYAGDAIHAVLIGIFCWQWYRATAPRPSLRSIPVLEESL